MQGTPKISHIGEKNDWPTSVDLSNTGKFCVLKKFLKKFLKFDNLIKTPRAAKPTLSLKKKVACVCVSDFVSKFENNSSFHFSG